ncbi:MAG: GAF domain-containing protein [Chloroflexi bacterium]|nr:MAG: GAF domain-containing protein [Chloroflexota bacterium]
MLVLVAVITLFLAKTITYDMTMDTFGTISALLYPVVYVAATGAALSVLFGLPAEEPRSAAFTLFVGIGLNALAFTLYLPALIQGSFVPGTFLDPLWMLGMAAIGIAGWQSVADRDRAVETELSTAVIEFSRMTLPAIVALASALLIVLAHLIGAGAAELVIDVAIALVVLVLSGRAGLALFTNWRLGEAERRRASQLQALYEVGLATAGELSLDDLTALVAREATLLTRTDGAMVSLAEPGNGFVIRALHKGPLLRLRDSVGEPLRGIALAVIESREMVVATDYSAHPQSTVALHEVIASALAVPLVAHGEIVGTLTAYSSRPRVFTEETLRLVRLYAAQAAIAVANARRRGVAPRRHLRRRPLRPRRPQGRERLRGPPRRERGPQDGRARHARVGACRGPRGAVRRRRVRHPPPADGPPSGSGGRDADRVASPRRALHVGRPGERAAAGVLRNLVVPRGWAKRRCPPRDRGRPHVRGQVARADRARQCSRSGLTLRGAR